MSEGDRNGVTMLQVKQQGLEGRWPGPWGEEVLTLKNGCFFTSSASLSLDPSLRSGFLRSSWEEGDSVSVFPFWAPEALPRPTPAWRVLTLRMTPMASADRKRGYRTSSLTMLSKTSSSSSPGNGDWEQGKCIRQTQVH